MPHDGSTQVHRFVVQFVFDVDREPGVLTRIMSEVSDGKPLKGPHFLPLN